MASSLGGKYESLSHETADENKTTSSIFDEEIRTVSPSPSPTLLNVPRLETWRSEKDHIQVCGNAYSNQEKDEDTTALVPISIWSNRPRKLKTATKRGSAIAADVFSILSALPFLGLALVAIHYNGLIADEVIWNRYKNASQVAATAFPIAFAAIVGRAVTKVAAWKLERGAKLGSLEQLMGSRTVFTTLYTQVALRSNIRMGIVLALFWTLSPLGGQSALRVMDVQSRNVNASVHLRYFDTSYPSDLASVQFSQEASEQEIGMWDALYTASLLASLDTKSSSMDIWGNVKIPYLSSYQSRLDSNTNETNSISVVPLKLLNESSTDADTFEYSSLIGVPITGLNFGTTNFSLTSSYLDLDCKISAFAQDEWRSNLNSTYLNNFLDFNQYRISLFNATVNDTCQSGSPDYKKCANGVYNQTFSRNPWDVPMPPNHTFHGFTSSGNDTTYTWSLGLDTFVDVLWMNDSFIADNMSQYLESPGIFLNEKGVDVNSGTLLFEAVCQSPACKCSVCQSSYCQFHDCAICNSKMCHDMVVGDNAAVAQLKTALNAKCQVAQTYVDSTVSCSLSKTSKQNCSVVSQHPSKQLHPPQGISHLSFSRMFGHLSSKLPNVTTPSDLDLAFYYLNDPSPGGMVNASLTYNADGPDDYIVTLARLGDKRFSQRLGQLLNTYILLTQANTIVTGSTAVDYASIHTNATAVSLENLYIVSPWWLAIFILAILAMLLAAIGTMIVGDRTFTPEVLGYCSLLLRDSKYADLPPGGGTLDGMELTKLLKETEVRFGVVQDSPYCGGRLGVNLKHSVTGVDENLRYL